MTEPTLDLDAEKQETREVEVNYNRTPDVFSVTAKLGEARIIVENYDTESDDDLATLVNSLAGIMNSVVEALEAAEEEGERNRG